jgi:hypothetical protein
MTAAMLAKSRRTAADLGFDHVVFREGLAGALPVADGWADVVISRAGWQTMLEQARFTDVVIGEPVDTSAGADGEGNARTFEVFGFPFLARRP